MQVARNLLGKVLCSNVDGRLTRAVITETEAYAGVNDRASHAYRGRRTQRTEPMYRAGGVAYVYLCYGIHHLFNVVTGAAGDPLAVLVRAASPLEGVDVMRQRGNTRRPPEELLAGPGLLSRALGIRTSHTGTSLCDNLLWIEDRAIVVPDSKVVVGPRVGIDYAGADAARPYRFRAPV